MASPVIEVHFLEGIDLDNSPPCDANPPPTFYDCPRPTVVRIKVKCQCRGNWTAFLCQECYEIGKEYGLFCHHCGGSLKDWVVI